MQTPSIAWGDYDSDGDLDLAVSGRDDSLNARLIVYRNDGGSFTNVAEPMGSDSGVQNSSIAWADYDNDGDLDLAVSGNDNSTNKRLIVYRNDGSSFTNATEPLGTNNGVYESSIAWGDYDSDGDLDLAVSGDDGSNRRLILFESDATSSAETNIRPPRPSGLTTSRSDTRITFFWDSVSGDSFTPEESISYNLRVGMGSEAISIRSADTSSDSVGAQLIGNAGLGDSMPLNKFRSDSFPIYWSVQAVDGGKMRSKWAPVKSLSDHGIQQRSMTSRPDTVNTNLSPFRLQLGSENGRSVFTDPALKAGDTLIVHTQREDSSGINVRAVSPAYEVDKQPDLLQKAFDEADSKLADQPLTAVNDNILSISFWKNSMDTPSNYLGEADTLTEDVTVIVDTVKFSGNPSNLKIAKLIPSDTRWQVIDSTPGVVGIPGNFTVSFTVASDTSVPASGFSMFRLVTGSTGGGSSSSSTCLVERIGFSGSTLTVLKTARDHLMASAVGRRLVQWYYLF